MDAHVDNVMLKKSGEHNSVDNLIWCCNAFKTDLGVNISCDKQNSDWIDTFLFSNAFLGAKGRLESQLASPEKDPGLGSRWQFLVLTLKNTI